MTGTTLVLFMAIPIPFFAMALIGASWVFRKVAPATASWFVAAALAGLASFYVAFLIGVLGYIAALQLARNALVVVSVILMLVGSYQTFVKSSNGTLNDDDAR